MFNIIFNTPVPPIFVVGVLFRFSFVLFPLTFDSNLKLSLAIVNVYVTVFSFL